MKNFNQDRGNRFGGGDRNGARKEVMMHRATCSNCGKSCEVPFRPTNGKPVYCKECFDKTGGNMASTTGPERSPRREFERRDFAPRFENRGDRKPLSAPAPTSDEVKRQLELVNAKLDKLIGLAESVLKAKPAHIVEDKPSLGEIVTKTISKKPSKKAKKD